jgi:hypothetical protein
MATDTQGEATEAPADDEAGDGGFWTRRVYALAAVIAVLRSPLVLAPETTAGMVGAAGGLVLGALALAGVLKAVYMVGKMAFTAIDPR